MKKIISVLLCLALLLSCAAALAETAEKTELKVNDELTLRAAIPEGYEMIDLTADDQILYMLQSSDTTKPVLVLSLGVDDAWPAGTKLNNIAEEDLKQIENSKFLVYEPNTEISYTETAYGTKLLVAAQPDKSAVVFYSLYEGYEVEFDLLNVDGSELTQEQIDTCVKFLSDLDFVFTEKK